MKIVSILVVATGHGLVLSSTTHAFLNGCHSRTSRHRTTDQVFLPLSTLDRRLSSATASSSLWMTSSIEAIPDRELVFQGMEAFRSGDVKGSIAKFDASVPEGARAYLWQRGISYYYNDDFALGSRQFRDDVLRSPLDVEEIVWDIACLLRMRDGERSSTKDGDRGFPPPNMMSLPPGKKDRRPIMATVYSLFRGEATEQDLAEVGHKGGSSEEFYSLFYLGLFNEARGETSKAEYYMKSAVKSAYAKAVASRDYMVDCAKVHCQLRGWRI